MKDEIIEVDGQRWKVRQAKSREHALNCIAEARVTGSVGCKDTLQKVNRNLEVESEEILADVVQINSDGTERKPYTQAY